jgi:hypothetical protein
MKTEQQQAPVNSASPAPAGYGSKAHHDHLIKIHTAINDGYGGVMPDGKIVDRREHPEAAPIPANPLMDTPEPQPGQVVGSLNPPVKP